MDPTIHDFFHRQELIPWFKQELIQDLTIAVLGVGGIGTNIALLLTRLGVGKVILIDMDRIEPSNLNRQSLYSKEDVGKKKVMIAKKRLDEIDNLNSEIIGVDYDIFKDWKKTIEIVKRSDYLMNGLDLPEIKRTLIGIACLKFYTPMIYCGTDPNSGYSGMVLYQSSNKGDPCHECLQAVLNSVEDISLLKEYDLQNIENHSNIDWRTLEKKDYKKLPPSATTIVTAMFASSLAVNTLLHSIHDHPTPHRIIFDLFTDNVEKFFLESRKECLVCGSGH